MYATPTVPGPSRVATRAMAAAVAAALLAGCAGTGRDTGSPALPEGDQAVVIQFDTRGSDPPAPQFLQLLLAAVPELTAYGDGRVIVTRGSAGQLAQLRAATVRRADLAGLLADADGAGLLAGEVDTGGAAFSHPSVTSLTLAGATTTNEVFIADLGEEDLIELTDDQRRARAAVADLGARLTALTRDIAEPHQPGGLAVYAYDGRVNGEAAATSWPLDRPLAEGGEPVSTGDGWRCLHISRPDEIAAVAAAARAAQGATWSSGGREWTVAVRPLLPHEDSCPFT